jgi:hypothetical protein
VAHRKMCKAIRANDTHGQGSQILLSPDLFRPTDPVSPSYLLQTHFLSEISAILSGKKRLAPLV